MKLPVSSRFCVSVVLISSLSILSACKFSTSDEEQLSVSPRLMTDSLHQLLRASRDAYAKNVVTPLSVRRNVIAATENWEEAHTLPLPAQMARYVSEGFAVDNASVELGLKSLWPINANNQPRSKVVREGLKAVAENPVEAFYQVEVVDGRRYYTAVYADVARDISCVLCHNSHPDSARDNFRGGDVLGGFVVRVALENKN